MHSRKPHPQHMHTHEDTDPATPTFFCSHVTRANKRSTNNRAACRRRALRGLLPPPRQQHPAGHRRSRRQAELPVERARFEPEQLGGDRRNQGVIFQQQRMPGRRVLPCSPCRWSTLAHDRRTLKDSKKSFGMNQRARR